MSFIITLDVGSTNIAAQIFRRNDGNVVGRALVKLEQLSQDSKRVEFDPEALWNTFNAAIEEALQHARIDDVREVAALGFTVQRNSMMLWERATSRPLTNLISWQDVNCAPLVKRWNRSFMKKLICGMGKLGYRLFRLNKFKLLSIYQLKTQMSFVKLIDLLRKRPDWRAQAAAGHVLFGCVETWLLWRLSGGAAHSTDFSCASSTGMFDLFQGCWSGVLLRHFGVPVCMLPRVCPSNSVFGEVDLSACPPLARRLLHTAVSPSECTYSSPTVTSPPPPHTVTTTTAETSQDVNSKQVTSANATTNTAQQNDGQFSVPICGICGDSFAAILGSGLAEPGSIKVTMGTGSFVSVLTGSSAFVSLSGLYPQIAWQLETASPSPASSASPAVSGNAASSSSLLSTSKLSLPDSHHSSLTTQTHTHTQTAQREVFARVSTTLSTRMYCVEGMNAACGTAIEMLRNLGFFENFDELSATVQRAETEQFGVDVMTQYPADKQQASFTKEDANECDEAVSLGHTLTEAVRAEHALCFVPGYAGLTIGESNDAASGLLIGLHPGVTPPHIVAAVLNSLANCVYRVLECLRLEHIRIESRPDWNLEPPVPHPFSPSASGTPPLKQSNTHSHARTHTQRHTLHMSGNVCRNDWLMQRIADLTGQNVRVCGSSFSSQESGGVEAGCTGVALLAASGLAVEEAATNRTPANNSGNISTCSTGGDVIGSLETIIAQWAIGEMDKLSSEKRFEPRDWMRPALLLRYERWKEACRRAFDWKSNCLPGN